MDRLLPTHPRPIFSANTQGFRNLKTAAAAISILVHTPMSAIPISIRWRRSCGRHGATAVGANAFLLERRILLVRPQRAFHCARNADVAGSDVGSLSAAPEHRPHPRSMAHDDPHRQQPSFGTAFARAVCRNSSSRMPRRRGLRRRWFCPRCNRAWPMRAQSCGHRAAAAGHAVRSNSLERRNGVLRAGRLVGRTGHRPILRTTGKQGDAGGDRTCAFRTTWLRAVAQAAHVSQSCLVGACRGPRGRRLSASRQWFGGKLAVMVRRHRGATEKLPNTRMRGGASIALRALMTERWRSAFSSAQRTLPWIGTRSNRCSRSASLSDEQRRLLLSGKSADGVGGAGPIVCACFGVGRTTICNAIASGQATVAGLGAELRAGTNCGSCIPELKRLIAQHGPQEAAEPPRRRLRQRARLLTIPRCCKAKKQTAHKLALTRCLALARRGRSIRRSFPGVYDMPLTPQAIETLKQISTATITTVLLKKGLRNIWMRGTRPLVAGQERLVGPAFTLRFVPAREDLATPESWSKPISTRTAIEAMPAGCIAVIDAMGITDAGVFGDILCARMAKRGVTALVTDGVVRDVEGVLGTGLPVWCDGAAAPPSVAGLDVRQLGRTHRLRWRRCIPRRCCCRRQGRRGPDPAGIPGSRARRRAGTGSVRGLDRQRSQQWR